MVIHDYEYVMNFLHRFQGNPAHTGVIHVLKITKGMWGYQTVKTVQENYVFKFIFTITLLYH